MICRERRRDILTAIMRTRPRRILLLVFMLAAVGVLAVLNSGSSFALRSPTPLEAASRLQIITPTPTAEEGSTAGSTNGILWMGVVIVVIILLPIFLRLGTAIKS